MTKSDFWPPPRESVGAAPVFCVTPGGLRYKRRALI
jgi:hypothetical protein